MFVHLGLYGVVGKDEWCLHLNPKADKEKTITLSSVSTLKNVGERTCKNDKAAWCKYITRTTRRYDGFSLYDTHGFNDFDARIPLAGATL